MAYAAGIKMSVTPRTVQCFLIMVATDTTCRQCDRLPCHYSDCTDVNDCWPAALT